MLLVADVVVGKKKKNLGIHLGIVLSIYLAI